MLSKSASDEPDDDDDDDLADLKTDAILLISSAMGFNDAPESSTSEAASFHPSGNPSFSIPTRKPRKPEIFSHPQKHPVP